MTGNLPLSLSLSFALHFECLFACPNVARARKKNEPPVGNCFFSSIFFLLIGRHWFPPKSEKKTFRMFASFRPRPQPRPPPSVSFSFFFMSAVKQNPFIRCECVSSWQPIRFFWSSFRPEINEFAHFFCQKIPYR